VSNLLRLAQGVDVRPALAELAANPDLWKLDTVRQSYPGSAHHDTQVIHLRGCADVNEYTAFNDIVAVDFPEGDLLPECCRLMYGIAGFLGTGRLGRVMVVTLKPGGTIDPHIDEGAYAEFYTRFHLSLQSADGNTYTVDGETAYMKPGELWWFDHRKTHTVANASEVERIHLILDCKCPRPSTP
jgi:hypothetical protein